MIKLITGGSVVACTVYSWIPILQSLPIIRTNQFSLVAFNKRFPKWSEPSSMREKTSEFMKPSIRRSPREHKSPSSAEPKASSSSEPKPTPPNNSQFKPPPIHRPKSPPKQYNPPPPPKRPPTVKLPANYVPPPTALQKFKFSANLNPQTAEALTKILSIIRNGKVQEIQARELFGAKERSGAQKEYPIFLKMNK